MPDQPPPDRAGMTARRPLPDRALRAWTWRFAALGVVAFWAGVAFIVARVLG